LNDKSDEVNETYIGLTNKLLLRLKLKLKYAYWT